MLGNQGKEKGGVVSHVFLNRFLFLFDEKFSLSHKELYEESEEKLNELGKIPKRKMSQVCLSHLRKEDTV